MIEARWAVPVNREYIENAQYACALGVADSREIAAVVLEQWLADGAGPSVEDCRPRFGESLWRGCSGWWPFGCQVRG